MTARWFSCGLQAACAVASTACSSALPGSTNQLPPASQQMLVLLQEAPELADASSEVQDSFILRAATLLSELPGRERGPTLLITYEDALRELEDQLATFGRVRMVVVSDPPGLLAEYTRSYAPGRGPPPVLTTDDSTRVDPAWYDVVCRDPDTGRAADPQRKDCTTYCRVTCRRPPSSPDT